MKLNPDCIRDILLFAESSTDISNDCNFDSNVVEKYFSNYSFNDVMYHLRQCELNDFFTTHLTHGAVKHILSVI